MLHMFQDAYLVQPLKKTKTKTKAKKQSQHIQTKTTEVQFNGSTAF